MRQAGRYLPEYRALRGKHSFAALAGDVDLATRVTLMPVERFGLDAAIVFADIASPLPAMGVDVTFDPGPVIARPIRDQAGIEALADTDPESIAPVVIATLSACRSALPRGTALIGFCGAPWTIAAYLIEGSGAREFPTLRAFAAARPGLLHRLLERLSKSMADYLIAQHRAGADVVQVFDSWAGLLCREDWERLVRPHLARMLEEVGATGVPRILFLQNAPHLVGAYAQLPAEVLSVDWRVDLASLQSRVGGRFAVQGNIDPAVLLAGPGPARAATLGLLDRVDAAGHIVNLGHGVLPETPLGSVEALVEAVHAGSAAAAGPRPFRSVT